VGMKAPIMTGESGTGNWHNCFIRNGLELNLMPFWTDPATYRKLAILGKAQLSRTVFQSLSLSWKKRLAYTG
jgi:hypothetical protein